MEPTQIIALALTVINQANKAIELANNGQAEDAEVALTEARSSFDAALDRWNRAG